MFLLTYLILLLLSLGAVAFYTLVERRVLGNFHLRIGPYMVGPMGILQPISDAVKLFCKGNLLLRNTELYLWSMSPLLAIFLYLCLLIIFPWGGMIFFFQNLILLMISIMGFTIYFVIFGSFYSGSKYPMIATYRSISQMISYEIILIFILLTMSSLFMGWNTYFKTYVLDSLNIMMFFPILIIWIFSILAETNRLPYDFLEGESELVSGFNTEYWGGMFSFLFIYEYGCMILLSILTSFLFFKSISTIFFIMMMTFFLWIRATVPRFRYDMLMNTAWKKFLPISISLLIIVIFLNMML